MWTQDTHTHTHKLIYAHCTIWKTFIGVGDTYAIAHSTWAGEGEMGSHEKGKGFLSLFHEDGEKGIVKLV